MEQKCTQCGEELFGAVNRCWNCGASVSVDRVAKIPPIRRAPVDLSGATGLNLEEVKQTLLPYMPELTPAMGKPFSMAGAIVGGIGCLLGVGSPWAILFGIVGVALALVGMQARRSDLATLGLVLSVISLFLGTGQLVFDLWTQYQARQWLRELQGIP